jgi:PAS domain-containing protein
MQQSTQFHIGAWAKYKKYVQKVVLSNETDRPGEVSYWRNAVFCNILTYLTPLSLIALVPSVFMAFYYGVVVIGISDLFAFFVILLITLSPKISLGVRKAIFVTIIFGLSVTLLYFLPLPAPGLLFALAFTIITSLIYSSKAALWASWANTFVCLFLGVFIYFKIDSPIALVYSFGSWIAISSNLILFSFAFTKCLGLLLNGLTKALNVNKISELKLEKTNRLYKFISQINQTIAHVKDAETLFQKSCDIAIEFGKYQMAWIGSFDDLQKSIVLLDSNGIPKQDIELLTDFPFETNSPEDFVLRTGTFYCSNNVALSLEMNNQKLFAEKHSIGSIIVLPIKKSGYIFGTFNLYAAEFDHFNQDDIALLKEVTGDISFALDMFEKTERHAEAKKELHKKFAELEAVSKQQSALLNTLPASIALLDHQGNILKVNDEWILFGKTNGLDTNYEHIGKNYIEIAENSIGTDKEDGKQMAIGLSEILSGMRKHFTMEYPCHSPDEKRWYKADVRPFRSQLLMGAVVMHFNISDRKKAEAEMLLLINNTEESFILLDNHLQIVSFNIQFNQLYKKFFGLDIQKGDSILDYVPLERKKYTSLIYEKVLLGNVEESEIEIADITGTVNSFYLKYSPGKDEVGNIFGVFVTAVDITEKKKALNLKEFERKNKDALINSTDDLIWSISNELTLIAANNAFINEMKAITGIEIKPGDDFSQFEVIPD